MKILITGANTPLATTISERISADHEVVATDAESEPANGRLLDPSLRRFAVRLRR